MLTTGRTYGQLPTGKTGIPDTEPLLTNP
jgi:hypothetical protein